MNKNLVLALALIFSASLPLSACNRNSRLTSEEHIQQARDYEAKGADFLLRVRLPYYAGGSREYRENLIRLADAQTRGAIDRIAAVLRE